MLWLLAGVATITAVELGVRLPLAQRVSGFRVLTERIVAVISSSRISDHWKEKVVPVYALRLFLRTTQFALLLALVLSPFVVAGLVSVPLRIPFLDFLSSLSGVLYTVIVGVAYAGVRTSRVFAGL